MSTPQLGAEKRTSILPTQSSSSDFLGPDYSYADELPLPDQVGVRKGDTLSSVMDSIKGVAYYSDMIGFGEASNPLTRSMGTKPYPLGVNYFLRTRTKCSNGADMWTYVNGIPEGTALGSRVKEAMRRLDLPALRGLAPGILEDAKAALDPRPILNSVLGTGYAKCKSVSLPVGDFKGRLTGQEGKQWVQPLFPGDIKYRGGIPFQQRWVFDSWMTQEQWSKENETRAFCPDGSSIVNHQDKDCAKPLIQAEGWKDVGSDSDDLLIGVSVITLLSLGTLLYLKLRSS